MTHSLTWADFYLICFAVGFCFSFLSFLLGSAQMGHWHLPYFHAHVGGAHLPAAHGPVAAGHATPGVHGVGAEGPALIPSRATEFRRSILSV